MLILFHTKNTIHLLLDITLKVHSFRGENCIKWFADELYNILVEPISAEVEESFQQTTTCHICSETVSIDEIRCRDHSHITGKYRGLSHQACNLKYQESRTIPVLFHGLSHYDGHFIIREVMSAFEGDCYVVPVTDENYISFVKTVEDSRQKGFKDLGKMIRNVVRLKFLDSYRFMNSSLDVLSKYLPSSHKTILHQEFPHLSKEKLQLLEIKGIYPYDFLCSSEKLNCTELPERHEFYNRLTDEHISENDYEHAQSVRKAFEIENLGQYSDLYMKVDILLLA